MINDLTAQQIHIYHIDLDQQPDWRNNLTSEEQQRADKMRIDHIRQRFINGRGFLRHCLSHYLQQDANTIELNSTEKGKLFLPDSNVLFNLAHSKNRAIYAFNLDYDIGIDIEHIRPLSDLDSIAKRVFSHIELDHLAEIDGDEKLNAFFKLWTRKEATIKASGEGLTAPLTTITTTDQQGAILNHIPYLQAHHCQLNDLTAETGFAACLAAKLHNRDIIIRNRP